MSGTVIDPNAAERGANETQDYGFFTVTRSGETDLTYPLTGDFMLTGTADPLSDYTLRAGPSYNYSIYTWYDGQTGNQRGSITIPQGQSSVSIRLDPFNDSIREEDETVILTLREKGDRGQPTNWASPVTSCKMPVAT